MGTDGGDRQQVRVANSPVAAGRTGARSARESVPLGLMTVGPGLEQIDCPLSRSQLDHVVAAFVIG